jgi:hypothetical protein
MSNNEKGNMQSMRVNQNSNIPQRNDSRNHPKKLSNMHMVGESPMNYESNHSQQEKMYMMKA